MDNMNNNRKLNKRILKAGNTDVLFAIMMLLIDYSNL